jgi:hypothetical protein
MPVPVELQTAAAAAKAMAVADAPVMDTLVVDEAPEFHLGPAAESSGGLELVPDSESRSPVRTRRSEAQTDAEGGDSSGELILSQPDTDEELSRQEKQEEERRAKVEQEEHTARLQRLAAERQRMLDEVKRRKADIDRSRRVQKRAKAERDGGEGFPWLQWAMRAAVAAAVIWGCFQVYDWIFGTTISHPSTYPFHGSVRFADGKPVNGGVLILVKGQEETEADIGPDGTFQTKTYSNNSFDGIPPGEYKIYLGPSNVSQQQVPPQYLRGGQTPWVVSVKRQDNVIDLVIQ